MSKLQEICSEDIYLRSKEFRSKLIGIRLRGLSYRGSKKTDQENQYESIVYVRYFIRKKPKIPTVTINFATDVKFIIRKEDNREIIQEPSMRHYQSRGITKHSLFGKLKRIGSK